VVYGTLSRRFGQCIVSPASASVFETEGTDAFTVRRDRGAGNRPAYEATFDNLRAENGGSGPFRTAAHKIVHIDNLRIRFFDAPQVEGIDANTTIRLGDLCSLFAPRRGGGLTDGGLGLLQELSGADGDVSISIDLANTAEVRIKGLDWEICRDGRTLFHARCRHARLQDNSSRIVLRGHAAVTVNGTTLESNCIALDVRANCVVVDGRYILTRAGQREFGAGSTFDADLKVLDAAS